MILTHTGTPVPQSRLRHNRWGGGGYSKLSGAHRDSLVASFREQWAEVCRDCGLREPIHIDEPVIVEIFLAGPRANSDLDNHAKQILDALVEARVLVDDDVRTVAELHVRRQLGIPKKGRYTSVEISPWLP